MKFWLIFLLVFFQEKMVFTKTEFYIQDYAIETKNEKFKILEIEMEIKNIKNRKINSIIAITKKNSEKSWFRILSLHYLPFIETKQCNL